MANTGNGNKEPKEPPVRERPERPDPSDKGSKRPEKRTFDPSRPERATGTRVGDRPSDRLEVEDKSDREGKGGARASAELDRALESLERSARDLICRKGFGAKGFKPEKEPNETEFDRGMVERTIDWTGLDSFMSERPVGDWGKFIQDAWATKEVGDKLQGEMLSESRVDGKLVNKEDRDKYFHCMFNCIGNTKGPGGEIAAAAGSMAKEVKDVAKVMMCKGWSYGAATRDSMRDQAANRLGRDAGRSGVRCSDACAADRTAFIKNMFR